MGRLHPNVLKVRKQKRQGRRAYLTSVYSLIKVPRSVGKADIPENARAMFDYRARGNTVSYDPWLDAIFPGVKQQGKERKFALELAEEQRLIGMVEDPDVCDYITLKTSDLQQKRLTFVFNRAHTRCFFIEVTYADANSFAMKSKVYGSKDRAMFDFEHKRISWMEFIELSTLSLVLPRRG